MHYVLMDIDGVMSPLGPISDPHITFPLEAVIRVREEVLTWFTALTQQPEIEVVWCSMRLEDSHVITRALGIPDLQVLDVDECKTVAIPAFIASTFTGEETYLWVDDDFKEHSITGSGAHDNDTLRRYSVKSYTGLTERDMSNIMKILNVIKEGAR